MGRLVREGTPFYWSPCACWDHDWNIAPDIISDILLLIKCCYYSVHLQHVAAADVTAMSCVAILWHVFCLHLLILRIADCLPFRLGQHLHLHCGPGLAHFVDAAYGASAI
jgi:hypothetical protein